MDPNRKPTVVRHAYVAPSKENSHQKQRKAVGVFGRFRLKVKSYVAAKLSSSYLLWVYSKNILNKYKIGNLFFGDKSCSNINKKGTTRGLRNDTRIKAFNYSEMQGAPVNNAHKLIEDFKDYRQEITKQGKPVVFLDFLEKSGLSSATINLKFSFAGLTGKFAPGVGKTPFISDDTFKDVDFTGCTFENCDFSEINFSRAQFKDCTFKNCNIQSCCFKQCTLRDSNFTGCNMQDACLEFAKISDCYFGKCDMRWVSACHSHIADSRLNTLDLSGANLWKAEVENTTVTGSNLDDCIGLKDLHGLNIDEKSCSVLHTKPVVVTMWDPENLPMSGSKLVSHFKKQGMVPFKLDYHSPLFDVRRLNEEIFSVLEQGKTKESASKTEQLLGYANDHSKSELHKLLAYIKGITKQIDGIALPGGEDIEAVLYGKSMTEEQRNEADMQRSMMEIALLDRANAMGVPLVGLCRGAQLGNVFYGGTLKHVEKEYEQIQTYKVTSSDGAEGLLQGIFGDQVIGVSAHKMAIDKVAGNLDIRAKNEHVVKAAETRTGSPQMYTQFHPEFSESSGSILASMVNVIITPENKNFFRAFMQCVTAYKGKKRLMRELNKK